MYHSFSFEGVFNGQEEEGQDEHAEEELHDREWRR